MLDFLGTVATVSLIVFVVSTLVSSIGIAHATRLRLAGCLGLWIGIAAAGAGAGWTALPEPFPIMGLFVAAPLLVAGLAAAWPAARRAMLSPALPLLVGLNIGRGFAILFLLLAVDGRLSGPFPYSAGWGDIITAAVAVPLVALARQPARHRAVLQLWNAFGLVDLVLAIALGVMSAEGSLLQVFAAPGSDAMQRLPWSFVPTVLVPLWMIIHVVIWSKLRRF